MVFALALVVGAISRLPGTCALSVGGEIRRALLVGVGGLLVRSARVLLRAFFAGLGLVCGFFCRRAAPLLKALDSSSGGLSALTRFLGAPARLFRYFSWTAHTRQIPAAVRIESPRGG